MRARVLADVVIVVTLLLQVVGAASPFVPWLKERRHGFLWPFLDYPMYAGAHHEGDAIDQFVIVGKFADGTERALSPADFDLNYWRYLYGPVAALRRHDARKLGWFIERYHARQRQRLVGLRLENRQRIVSREGLRPGPTQVVAEVELG